MKKKIAAVELRPMTDDEYAAFRTQSIAAYAEDKARSGWFSPEEARKIAEDSEIKFLPQGKATPGNHFFTVLKAGALTRVGSLWFDVKGEGPYRRTFLLDIIIEESLRGLGYGKAAMLAFESEARKLGARRAGLHVFGHNLRAKALYDTLGYRIDDWTLTKPLGASPPIS